MWMLPLYLHANQKSVDDDDDDDDDCKDWAYWNWRKSGKQFGKKALLKFWFIVSSLHDEVHSFRPIHLKLAQIICIIIDINSIEWRRSIKQYWEIIMASHPTPPPPNPPDPAPHLPKGWGRIVFGTDPVGVRFRVSIGVKLSCSLCNLNTLWNIFMILGRNVEQDKATCPV